MRRVLKALAKLGIFLAILIVSARVLFPLPDISDRVAVAAIARSDDTALGRVSARLDQPGLSGVIPLAEGTPALASRLMLAEAAEASIDAQYYIWHDDVSGILLLNALFRAAERGVRVRLLLDDNGVPGLDSMMAALNSHENFQIRLFNPSTVRRPKMAGYTFDFFRMNRRMHNKSFIADGAAAIIGGRNIGDEYFQVGDDVFYVDMDVMAMGAIVPETAVVFDAYWNSASVFEVESIVSGPGDMPAFLRRVGEVTASAAAKDFVAEAQGSIVETLSQPDLIEWTTVQLVADDPVKGQGLARDDQLMIARLGGILGDVTDRLDLVSAYFIPGKPGTAFFTALAGDGKEVRILTNALNTTDVFLVHAGYSKYRRDLLSAGVELFELKLRGTMTPEADLQIRPLGLSGASLHAKTFAVDDKRVFIGSFNFDPRSARLNCEMGFLIDSPTMARQVSSAFDGPLETLSYKPALTPGNKMIWREAIEGQDTVVYQQEPGASWLKQISFVIIGVLPVEWML